ncbi:MAG: peptide deformylase [Candidatus Paceibacterota bacterium]|jgi:peptide deformylase
MNPIVTIHKKENEAFLRKKTEAFDFSKYDKKELLLLVKTMRETMKKANGVGLSANQVGRNECFFVAQVPDTQGRQKFYAIFNPVLTKISSEMITIEEGCLSVPEVYGPTPRAYRVTLEGFDIHERKIKIKAWGLLARVFQHETDHLNGKLFIDKAKTLTKLVPKEKLPPKK